MTTYVSKPTEIEAIQYTGDNLLEVQDFVGVLEDGNTFGFRRTKDRCKEWSADEPVAELWVAANNEWLGIVIGEWIARDSLGCYPIKDEVFTTKYTKSLDEQALDLLRTQSTDAEEWARVFYLHVRFNPAIPFCEGTMVGWFANAIETAINSVRNDHDKMRRWLEEDIDVNEFLTDEQFYKDIQRGKLVLKDDYFIRVPDCHCGRPSIVHEDLDNFTRGLCAECDLVRCDVDPTECPYRHELRTKPGSGDLTPVSGSGGGLDPEDPESPADPLLTALQNEADRATQEASGGVVESIQKETGINE